MKPVLAILHLRSATLLALALPAGGAPPVPDNLVVEGVPAIPDSLRAGVSRYLEFRAAAFNSWHPRRREMLVTTRFADTPQLHRVRMPGGARQQLTFFVEPVRGGAFRPKVGDCLVYSQDVGGGEFYQLHRLDLADGRSTLLTDGKSRNTGAVWSYDGQWLAYSSTRRNGRDTDIHVVDPHRPEGNRLAVEVNSGGWGVADWSRDGQRLLLYEYVSINQSHLHLADVATGARRQLTPRGPEQVAYGQARFSVDGRSVYVTTDQGSEFRRLVRIDLGTGRHTPLTDHIPWDIEEFALTRDGHTIAFVANEDGIGTLRLLDTRTGRERRPPPLPAGLVSGLEWHENGRDLAFTLSSARSPSDAWSLDVRTGRVERWTESETGGLIAAGFAEPELIRTKSFDGRSISAFVYRPDSKRFPGRRPVLLNIHGGPESQTRPGFQLRYNYLLEELGVAIVHPNVRGSSGYGKTFLTLDNGSRREDSVRDIGAILDWVQGDAGLDAGRVAVFGGSYGGYMVLASLIHFGDRLRCGIDVVGISNFVTFLTNTQDYRRDLRRAEYGDERDPEMRAFLEKISPARNAQKITRPLLVVQGLNDPRVPVTESEQMVKAIRDRGGQVWYLMARDEGHGFAKKKNVDFQFLSMILFLREHLLK